MEIPPSLRPIPGLEGYYAKRDGTIWSTRWGRSGRSRRIWFAPKQLQPLLSCGNGYAFVWIKDGARLRKMSVHRLVLLAFRGLPQPGQETRHRDGDRTNNRLGNLRWGTPRQNARDKVRHGTSRKGVANHMLRGERHHQAKLTREQASNIRERARRGASHTRLAREYGVSISLIGLIRDGKLWKCLDDPPVEPVSQRRRYPYRRLDRGES
jgi:hypothetical protein